MRLRKQFYEVCILLALCVCLCVIVAMLIGESYRMSEVTKTAATDTEECTEESLSKEPAVLPGVDIMTAVEDEPTAVVIPVDKIVSSEPTIDDYELYLLAHLIYAEAGSDGCSDKMQLYVGSVVLNRMAYWWYPDTMYEVIYQKGQYACTWDGNFEKEPNQQAWDAARYLLTHGSQLPANVIFQAEFKQGDGVYEQVQNMYFCYKND